MTINRWLGVAQAKIAKQALQPFNVTPGSVWVLRVGSQSYVYIYPASIEVGTLSDNDRAQVVTDGLVDSYSGGAALGGGATALVGSVTSELYAGRWSVVVTGPASGAPLDVELTGSDPEDASISVIRLQPGRAAQNEIQRIKFPGTPTAGNWKIRYRNDEATVAYNVSAASLETALEGLSSIGSSNVTVTGSYTAGYEVEFVGALAGTSADTIVAYSLDFVGTASYKLDVTTSGGIGRQEYTLDALSNDVNQVYAFMYGGTEQSHLFTGATTVAALIAALESIESIGTGNAYVQQLDDGSYTITLIGEFVGVDGDGLSLIDVSGGNAETALDATTPTFDEVNTEVVITILNMPYHGAGTLTFSYDGNTTAAINYNGSTTGIVDTALSAAGITGWACTEVSGGQFGSRTYTFLNTTGEYDAGVILPDVSDLIGCNAIDVRTTQIPLTARNEVQQFSIDTDPTGGTFTLTFDAQTTSGLAYNATAATIQTAFEALSSVGASNATVSGPVGGPFIVEFKAALAADAQDLITGSGASLTLPTLASVTELTVLTPTGPNWWTNAGNWSLGTVPGASDVPTFDAGSIGCLYGIENVAAVAGIDIYRTYTGNIGLPERTESGSPETLPQYLSLQDGGGTIPIRIGLGDDGAGPSIIRIDTQSQDASVSLLYSVASGGNQVYAVGLAGDMSTIHAADCSLQIATAAGLTATVGSIRVSPQNKEDDGAVVEWGEGAVVTSAELVAGTLRMGSVPSSLTVHDGLPSVRGLTGTLNSLVLRNARLRYLAGGSIGKYGSITALTTSSSLARLTSASHGLVSGDRIFLRGVVGIVGLSDGYYTVSRVDANTFDLVGTAPTIPYGAIDPVTVSSYYASGAAQWGLADAVRIGSGGILDMSELSITRTIVAPILMQAFDAQVIDTLATVSGLRIKSDPGSLEESLGNRALIKRD